MQNKANERGLFPPTESHINFAVPDVKSLTKSSDNIPTITECGIIEKSLELLDRDKEYVLLIDGKKIAIGLGKGLGHLLVENFTKKIGKDELEGEILQNLTSIVKNMSDFIKDVRLMDLGHKKLLRMCYNLAKNHPDRSGYELGIKAVKGFIYTLCVNGLTGAWRTTEFYVHLCPI